ncbi:MAG: T9SS type A sorting domain-containing protein, partial [Flavobacteriaceae bacterium]|nr:T9SS type A sorting domain-containing protein [Flavobacteriaceae bacterium]
FIEENIVLYPNPSSSGNVKILGFVQGLKYDIYNTLGQILKSGILESDQISIENFSNHVYFVKLTEIESNKSVIKKIILGK